MSVSGYKRLTVVLAVLCGLLALVSVSLFIGYAPLKLHLAFASEQVHIFDEMRDKALHSDASDAAGCLEYVVNYYPSGTKQESGSRLDRMVESARGQSVREILAYLRTKTGEDLGTDPESWIKKYAKRPNQRASLDAAVAFCLHFGGHWRRASEPERWARLLCDS